jgi:hypothetical protein
MRRISLAMAVVFVLAVNHASQAASIYRCSDPAGVVLFTDLPCRNGQLQQLDPTRIATVPSLTPDEVARVAQIDAQVAQRRRAQLIGQTRQDQAASHAAIVRARNCASARDGLQRIRQIKRRGYAAASAADLDARQRKYALQGARNCD